MRDDFAVFILSHGRADKVITLKTLQISGYTGKWYIIIDNEDKQADRYYTLFGHDHVIMFDKLAESKKTDTMHTSNADRRVILYARNACFQIAKDLGIKYFLELDDDYLEFRTRYDKDGVFSSLYVTQFDAIVDEMLEFLDTSGAITVAFSQMGDFIGGMGSKVYKERLSRKAMNSFFCTTDRPFKWFGRINEDVNAYTTYATQGKLMFTVADVSLNQPLTQASSGGMSEMYLGSGTYVKSFYTVIACPSGVKVSEVGAKYKRIHHIVNWENVAPKIISDTFKKKRN